MARKRARSNSQEDATTGSSRNKIAAVPAAADAEAAETVAQADAGKDAKLAKAMAAESAAAAAAAVEDVNVDDMSEGDGEGSGDSSSASEDEDEDEDGDDADDQNEGDNDDSDGDVRDFRKRLRRKRDKDRLAAAEANGANDAEVSNNGMAAGTDENGKEEQGEGDGDAMEFCSDGTYRNKQRVLLFSSRGITSRFRHLLGDMRKLIPHHKKDVKLDVGRGESLSSAVNEIAEIKSCNSCVFLECRKKTDLYLWAGKSPDGPSAKFHVLNVHTMDELKLTGNCMLGSRPLLSFDAKFDQTPHWKVLKGILMDIFNTPRGHPKSKPFIDRVMSFFVADGKVWVRNYQIVDKGDGSTSALNRKIEQQQHAGGAGEDTLSLVEMGPRFVLNPIRVFAGSFGGPTLYQNSAYVSPNDARSARKRQAGAKFEDRQESKKNVKEKKKEPAVPRGPLDDVFAA